MKKKQVDMYVLIEKSLKDRSDNTARKGEIVIFGPFETEAKAAHFCHDRIRLLASEWVPEEDGMLTDCLAWKIDHILQVADEYL
jgi:hypothetical protein